VTVLDAPAGSKALRSRVGYVTQAPALYGDLSVRENLNYFGRLVAALKGRIDEVLATVDLERYQHQLAWRTGRTSLPDPVGLVVPVVLITILKYVFDGSDTFDRIGGPLLGIFPLLSMFLVTSIAMLRERTTGTLERLLTLPVGSSTSCSATQRRSPPSRSCRSACCPGWPSGCST
jgi:hypothetical protein